MPRVGGAHSEGRSFHNIAPPRSHGPHPTKVLTGSAARRAGQVVPGDELVGCPLAAGVADLLDDDRPDKHHTLFPDSILARGQVEFVPDGQWAAYLAHPDRDTPAIGQKDRPPGILQCLWRRDRRSGRKRTIPRPLPRDGDRPERDWLPHRGLGPISPQQLASLALFWAGMVKPKLALDDFWLVLFPHGAKSRSPHLTDESLRVPIGTVPVNRCPIRRLSSMLHRALARPPQATPLRPLPAHTCPPAAFSSSGGHVAGHGQADGPAARRAPRARQY